MWSFYFIFLEGRGCAGDGTMYWALGIAAQGLELGFRAAVQGTMACSEKPVLSCGFSEPP